MLRTAAHTLPGAVGLLQPRGGYQKDGAQSAVIKNCLQYISTHLHEELRLEELAHECGLRSRSSTAITRTAHTNRRKEGDTMVSDGDFYRQYLNGDDAGLEALMEKYGDPLTVYLDGYLHDIHEAEELMLDVFAYLFTKKPRIREGGFKAYLYKAARHMALRHKSKRKLMFSLDALTDEPDGQQLAEEVIGTAERNRILHYCMGEMNPDYREVLYLTYFEGIIFQQKLRKHDLVALTDIAKSVDQQRCFTEKGKNVRIGSARGRVCFQQGRQQFCRKFRQRKSGGRWFALRRCGFFRYTSYSIGRIISSACCFRLLHICAQPSGFVLRSGICAFCIRSCSVLSTICCASSPILQQLGSSVPSSIIWSHRFGSFCSK